jgi:hypothetical protein
MILSLSLLSLSAVSATPNVEYQFQQWERRLRSKVAERNIVPAAGANDAACNVVVGFTVGRNRRPAGIEVVNSSCNFFYDRQAQRLVRTLGRIGQVPSASGQNHRVLLSLTYGRAPDSAADRRLTDAMEAERQAYLRRNLAIVSFGNPARSAGLRGAE